MFGHVLLSLGDEAGYLPFGPWSKYPLWIAADKCQTYLDTTNKSRQWRGPIRDLANPAAAVAERLGEADWGRPNCTAGDRTGSVHPPGRSHRHP